MKNDKKEERKALLIRMDANMHKRLKICAIEEDNNMTTIVLRLIREYLNSNKEQ